MIKDYLRSPEYFCRKYVLKSVTKTPTPSLKIGSMVDAILSNEPKPYQVAVLKRDNPTLYDIQKSWPEDKLIAQSDADKAEAMAKAISRCKFWAPGLNEKRLMQVILESAFENMQLCGKPDIVRIFDNGDEKTPVRLGIWDLKTTQPNCQKNAFTWHRTCEDWGYYLQLAMYRKLVLDNLHLFVEAKRELLLEFGFVTVSIDRDGVTKVALYSVPSEALDPYEQIIYDTLRLIKEGNFTDPEPSWETATRLFPDSGTTIDDLKNEAPLEDELEEETV